MRIHLVRHGKPDFWAERDFKSCVTGQELSELWREYMESGILPDSIPPTELLECCRSIPQVYSSDAKRAIESVQKLSATDRLHINPLFREAEIPHGFWPRFTLPFWAWSTISRIVWLLGYSRNCESFAAFRRRGHAAAAWLIERVEEHDEVMLVAHGWLNGAIFYALTRKGWQADGRFQRRYWGWNILTSPLVPSRDANCRTALNCLTTPLMSDSLSERISHEQKRS